MRINIASLVLGLVASTSITDAFQQIQRQTANKHHHLTTKTSSSKTELRATLAQNTINIDRNTAQRDVNTFQNWAIQNGVQYGDGFCLNYYEMDGNEEYYAAAANGGPQGSAILVVPGGMIMSADKINQEFSAALEPSMLVLQDKGLQLLSQHFVLFLKVLSIYQEGMNSPYYPWMESLPRKYNTGVSMDDFCLSCLPPYIKSLCETEIEQLDGFREALRKFQYISPEIKTNKELTKFAYNVVFTRAFQDGGDFKIIPMADMLNHGHPGNVELAYDQNGNCGVILTRDVGPGEPLLLSYGEDSNPSQFLATYGFMNNPRTTFCKLYFPNASRKLIDCGYNPSKMVFDTETGAVAPAVWDVMLYSRLERKSSETNMAQAFHQVCKVGDEEGKGRIHSLYFRETCQALLRHVEHILIEVNDLKVQMNRYDSSSHPRLPLLQRHHELVLTTFQKVRVNLENMLRQMD